MVCSWEELAMVLPFLSLSLSLPLCGFLCVASSVWSNGLCHCHCTASPWPQSRFGDAATDVVVVTGLSLSSRSFHERHSLFVPSRFRSSRSVFCT
ncbi:hypothetical protein M758_7G173600 [Ceratodon purpureus]|uniref:Secreted protein n=1 Tax=Ceratodon purpureus TaxID=3225 RepID=A0A8T0HBC3_CERPU|nr:hypothetical protein KC19_7G176600 [Ceratodon purpureus]KAG0611890.1 hypothetical protein M758_7G173600 [Ceratodon purpureus]